MQLSIAPLHARDDDAWLSLEPPQIARQLGVLLMALVPCVRTPNDERKRGEEEQPKDCRRAPIRGLRLLEQALGELIAQAGKRRGVAVELVGVRPDPAVLGLVKDESKRIVEFLMRAEPNVLASTHVDVGLEHVGMGGAYP